MSHYYDEAVLQALADTYREGQRWECKPPDGKWHLLPQGYKPAWFYDTEYRMVSQVPASGS